MRREWLVRALRTFVQAALGFAAANAAGVVGEGTAIKDALAALTVASVAAGLAALMNIHKLGSASPTASAEGEDDADASGLDIPSPDFDDPTHGADPKGGGDGE